MIHRIDQKFPQEMSPKTIKTLSRQEGIMHTLIATTLRICFRFSLFVLAAAFACCLPMQASPNLPVCPAVLRSFRSAAFRTVPARRKHGWATSLFWLPPITMQWYAVVGLPLDMTPGSHELRVKIGDETKTQDFMVNPKDYPEQHVTLKDKSKVELSPADEARADRELACHHRS